LHIREFTGALGNGELAVDYIEMMLRAATSDLKRFPHKQILLELMKSPDGVSTDIFEDVTNKGANLAEPTEVAQDMKKRQAIYFHHPSGEYRLSSTAYRTALLTRWRSNL